MFTVEIEKRCGCFTRSKMEGSFRFESREEAIKKAEELLKIMNEKFCGAHKFRAIDEGALIRIVEDEGRG